LSGDVGDAREAYHEQKSERAMMAMLTIKKLDIAELERARAGVD